MESLTSFWRAFLFGIAAAMAGVIGLAQIPGWSTIDGAALDHLLQDARIIIPFGPGLIRLAGHRWLWPTDKKADGAKE